MKASRRNFLIGGGVVGTGLVIGFSMGDDPAAPAMVEIDGAFVPNAFLQLSPDGDVRFYCPRDEMGQGVSTGLATLIGEELDIDPAKIVIEWAGPHPDYVNPLFGVQGTGGSTSIAAHFTQLRQVSADTRATLLDAAGIQLGVDPADLTTDDGFVINGSTRHPFGEFVTKAAELPPRENTPLKGNADFRYIGKEHPRLDSVGKATGTAEFGIDVDVPGMLYAVVKHPPVARSTVASFDGSEAKRQKGVVDVIAVATGVAVVAERYWQAKQAVNLVDVEWDEPELAGVDTERLKADYKAALDAEETESAESVGDVLAALEGATSVRAEYWAPYLVHAPMEPMNAVVRVGDGEAEVWTGSQGVGVAQGLVARFADIDAANVKSHNTYLGGGFGRRATLTHVIEATQASMATGRPVKVVWSREDDIRSGVFRPASLMGIEAGIDDDGAITAWSAKRVGGNMLPTTLGNMLPAFVGLPDGMIDWIEDTADSAFANWIVEPSSIEGLAGDYDLPNREVLHTTVDHGLPLTFWRSVGHSFTAFAKESMVDELAHAVNRDPVDVRLKNTSGNPRMRSVIEKASELMAAMTVPEGHGLGMAAHGSFNSYVAEVAEVSVENGRIRVHNVLCVVDCGLAVNPDVVRAQLEGSVMFGLTAALHGNLDLEAGAIKQSNFHDYPIVRMTEAPKVDVVIIDSDAAPTGVGEPGVPPIAPAVANAVFAAAGQRLRTLPLKLETTA